MINPKRHIPAHTSDKTVFLIKATDASIRKIGIKKTKYNIFTSMSFQNFRKKISKNSFIPFFFGAFLDMPEPLLSKSFENTDNFKNPPF